MYQKLYIKLLNTLKAEMEYIKRIDVADKSDKMLDILHCMQVLQHYEELEPIIAEYLDNKAKKSKWANEEERS